ncbi:hypothetical protein PoB_007087600 [Plakobranchus ocellatus]|uniref:Uncharacterized protein n=1 Tax=Plakobranchus ocellatus TaxID=259542 RepID=A0AAV4DKG9_9GAST|nr:hypothetical protein PoB_007087600 [Plakobranchus ocellatus]
MLKKREEKLFERLVIGQGSQLVSYANQRLKGLKFADCLVYRKVTFRFLGYLAPRHARAPAAEHETTTVFVCKSQMESLAIAL